MFSGLFLSRKTGHSSYFQFITELQIVLRARNLAQSSDSGVPGSPTQWIVASSPATQDKQWAAHELLWNCSFSWQSWIHGTSKDYKLSGMLSLVVNSLRDPTNFWWILQGVACSHFSSLGSPSFTPHQPCTTHPCISHQWSWESAWC